jgi:hypothetical protein
VSAVAVSAVANISITSSSSGTAAQPSTAQVARFEQQLQAPAQFYQSPMPDATSVSGNWRVVMSDVTRLDEQYRVDNAALETPDSGADSMFTARESGSPAHAAEVIEKGMSKLTHMSYTMMSISFVTTAERLAGENVRSLYQMA